MKKVLIFVLCLTFLSCVSAIDYSFEKTNYQPGETVQIELNANFIKPLSYYENIFFYKQGIPRALSRSGGLVYSQGKYYIYLRTVEGDLGNCSIKLENVQYEESGIIKTSASIPLTLSSSNSSALSINPGIVYTSKDFSVRVKPLNSGQEITAKFNDQSITKFVPAGLESVFEFSVSGLESQITELTINDYAIKVFIENPSTNSCTPDCTNKSCGDDGCGGTCGSCLESESCENSKCVSKYIQCSNECNLGGLTECVESSVKTCGNFDDDECLEYGNSSICWFGCLNGNCTSLFSCTPDCTNKSCGDDGCGGTCGECNSTFFCSENFTCVKFPKSNLTIYSKNFSIKTFQENENKLYLRVVKNQKFNSQIILVNFDEYGLSNVYFSTDLPIIINESNVSISPQGYTFINLTIGVESDFSNETLSGFIYAHDENTNVSLPVTLELVSNISQTNLSSSSSSSFKHCSEIGVQCTESQTCSGYYESSLEGSCCVGECATEKTKTSKWLIGLFLALIIGLILFMAWFKIKQSSKQNPKKLLEKQTRDFEDRMNNREVRGGLGRI